MVQSVEFKTEVSSKWKCSGDTIDKLEDEIYVIGLWYMESSPLPPVKHTILFVYNTTNRSPVRKRWSSSCALNKICQNKAAVSFQGNILVLNHWIPSALNPTDSPSRKKNVPRKKTSWEVLLRFPFASSFSSLNHVPWICASYWRVHFSLQIWTPYCLHIRRTRHIALWVCYLFVRPQQ